MITRVASVIVALVLLFGGAGCSMTKQSANDVNAGLLLVVPPRAMAEWPLAKQGTTRLAANPRVLVAWAQSEPYDGAEAVHATKATREGWITALRNKIERAGTVATVVGAAPDRFDDGVTLAGVQQLAADYGADVVVLFTFDVRKRRYHASEWGNVWSELEVVTLAHAVGITASGVPILSKTQKGFASGSPIRGADELEALSTRSALDALADSVVQRFRMVVPEPTRR